MTRRRSIADLVFGVPELEEDRGPISRIGWLIESPAQLQCGGVRCAAGQRGPCCLAQHRDDFAVPGRRSGQQMQSNRAGVSALLGEKSGRSRVEVGLLCCGQIVVDRGTHDRVDESKRFSAREHRKIDQARGQPGGLAPVQSGQPSAQAQPGLLPENGRRTSQCGRFGIQPADTQQHCCCDSLGRETVHRLRVDGVDSPGVAAELAEQLGQKKRVTTRGLGTRATELRAGVLAHSRPDQAGDRGLAQRAWP